MSLGARPAFLFLSSVYIFFADTRCVFSFGARFLADEIPMGVETKDGRLMDATLLPGFRISDPARP